MKNRDKNQYRISFWEQIYPLLFALVTSCIVAYFFYKYEISMGDEINSVISNIIVFVSIIIGFIGVLLGILLSLKNEEKMKYFLCIIEKSILKRYFVEPMVAGISSIVWGCSIFFQNSLDSFFVDFMFKNLSISKILICIWLFFTIHMVTSAYRIMDFMFEVIFSDCTIQKRERIVEDENVKNELKEKYSKK